MLVVAGAASARETGNAVMFENTAAWTMAAAPRLPPVASLRTPRYAALFATDSQPQVVVGSNGHILDCNVAFGQLLGSVPMPVCARGGGQA